MKKVGIITMHKVPNYGSALQAYALQQKVALLGYDVELIDYYYPNQFHCDGQGVTYFPPRKLSRLFVLNILGKLLLILGMKSKKTKALEAISRFEVQKNFRKFYRRFFKLSSYYGRYAYLWKGCSNIHT